MINPLVTEQINSEVPLQVVVLYLLLIHGDPALPHLIIPPMEADDNIHTEYNNDDDVNDRRFEVGDLAHPELRPEPNQEAYLDHEDVDRKYHQ